MKRFLKIALAAAGLVLTSHVVAQVTLYERDGLQGRSFTTNQQVNNLAGTGFNDRSSSASVRGARSERWEVCENSDFGGRCVILRQGDYPSLAAMGLNDRISSVRAVSRDTRISDNRYAPTPPAPQVSQIAFYEQEGFQGRNFSTREPLRDLRRSGFNDRISSIVVSGERWEVCQNIRYNGRCVVLRPGQYASLAAIGLNDRISSVRNVSNSARVDDSRYAPMPQAPQATQVSQIVFYENDGFNGISLTSESPMADLRQNNFNNRASSVVVRGERWEVCDQASYYGRCVVLRPGQYASLSAMGLNDRVSSARIVSANTRVDDSRYGPMPVAGNDYGRRNQERVYEANITSVRAVVENSGQRCWVEREQVPQERSKANVPGALLGAVIGGVLGHQVGGGSGKDVATGVGAFAGAAIGANVGRSGGDQPASAKDVQRCTTTPGQAHPAYWDVTYNFRGVEHRVQMNQAPGATVQVNEQGEPRV